MMVSIGPSDMVKLPAIEPKTLATALSTAFFAGRSRVNANRGLSLKAKNKTHK